jgi:hypothetical protein
MSKSHEPKSSTEAYEGWIAEHYSTLGSAVGACSVATNKMVKAFPELVKVAGWCNGHEHYWCVAPDGTVVDPTARQFTDVLGSYRYPELHYRAWEPGDKVRVGRCMNCGDDIYKEVQSLDGTRYCVCSDECHQQLVMEYNAQAENYRTPAL